MKLYPLIILLSVVALACNSRESVNEGTESAAKNIVQSDSIFGHLAFDTTINDLGQLKEGEQVIAWFAYENDGKAPVIIQKIDAGCGCTIPQWKTEPLEPGKKEHIKVLYNSAGKHGMQNIRVTVRSNASNPVEELRILAKVESTD